MNEPTDAGPDPRLERIRTRRDSGRIGRSFPDCRKLVNQVSLCLQHFLHIVELLRTIPSNASEMNGHGFFTRLLTTTSAVEIAYPDLDVVDQLHDCLQLWR